MKLFSGLFRRKKINPNLVALDITSAVSAQLGALSALREQIVNSQDSLEQAENKAVLDSYDELRVLAISAARTHIIAYTGIEEPIRRQICSAVDKLLSEVCADLASRIDFDARDSRYFQVFVECKDSLFLGDGAFKSRLVFVFNQFCRGGGAPDDPILIDNAYCDDFFAGRLAVDIWCAVFFKTSEIFCNQRIKLEPNDTDAWYKLGDVYRRQGRLDDAVAAYGHAVKLKPDYAGAWFQLGGTYALQGKRLDALAALDHIRKLDPSMADKLAEILSRK